MIYCIFTIAVLLVAIILLVVRLVYATRCMGTIFIDEHDRSIYLELDQSEVFQIHKSKGRYVRIRKIDSHK